MSNRPPHWPEDQIRQALKLWNAGRSAGQIAAEMPGKSRSAVISQIRRVARNEPGSVTRTRENTVTQRCPAAEPRPPQPRKPRRVLPMPVKNVIASLPVPDAPAEADLVRPPCAPESLSLPLVDLGETQCHWPTGREDGQTLFCGNWKEALAGPYCCHHARIAVGTGTKSERAVDVMVRKA